ncbi:MAG: hypothetical protein HOO91_21190 [Bacteroidales bacterium]|nr:hypothetical protein [Bacteroidales bacterium]
MKVQSSKGQVVELAPFILKNGVTEVSLLDASETLQKEFLVKQTGFIKRELVKKLTGEYIDIVYWTSQENADRASQNAMNSPVCFAYFHLMKEADQNDPNAGVSHFVIINEY